MHPLHDWGARFCGALAALLFAALLASLTRVPHVPSFILAGLAALAILSALRPDRGLLSLAMTVPIAAWLGRQWHPSVAWPEALVVAFCAGYCARRAARSPVDRPPASDPLAPPFVLFVALVAASLVVQILVDAWRFGNATIGAEMSTLLTSAYFLSSSTADPVDAAMRLLETLIVLRAAVTVTRDVPGFALRATQWVVCGATAAAALNLLRLWEAAMRLDSPVTAFFHYLLTQRLNVHYADVNAAGSYFVLTLFAALGLALAPKGRAWLISIVLIGSSIWVAGSRLAMMTGLLAILLPTGARVMRIRRGSVRGTTLAVAALVLALLAAGGAYLIPERGNQQSAITAVHVRWELAQTSVRMAASAPMFGVGIGRYYSRSGEFSSPQLLRLFPPAVHENAHNNFLQILGELGLVGLIALVWLLGAAAWLAVRLLRANIHDPVRWGLVTGLFAFVLSWLGSHPLLIDEPATTFWLVLGIVCGWGLTIAPAKASTRPAAIVGALVVAAVVSIPLRVVQQRADFDLQHRGVGLSAWQEAVEGVRYRFAGETSSVFIPSEAQTITMPVRSVHGISDVRLHLTLDGRPADIVNVPADRWQVIRLHLPQDRHAPRFRRLELRVENAPSNTGSILMLGKVESR
ncbi:MAG TPA: O-antigen ligase family protein [Vicinamibacterales bacterium]|jgi:O-antigen ligase